MRHLVTIQKIAEVQPIDGADAIEKVRVKEWWVVSKKGTFKVGDLCRFYEIDSFLPVEPEYDFLLKGSAKRKMVYENTEREGIRLKTVKLRGQISQGLALPLKEGLPQEEGSDISELLNVVKWEAPVPACISGTVKGCNPGFFPKTDEERIQNCSDVLERHRGELFYIASKLDGTSGTFYRYKRNTKPQEVEFGCCGHNWEMKEDTKNVFWKLAKQLEIDTKLPEGYAIQGEVVGEGIQKNRLKIKGQKVYFYNVWDIHAGRYLSYAEFRRFIEDIGLETVPIIHDYFTLNHTVEDLLEMANDKSPLGDFAQEGIVLRPLVEQTDMINGSLSRLSFKVINNEYLLKNDE